MDKSQVSVVRSGECVEADPSPGVVREQAFVRAGMWSGRVTTEPGTVSGWHHHGDHDTSIYVSEGVLRLEFGPGGTDVVRAGPGDFVHVGKGVVHREGNPSEVSSRLIVTRAGQGAVTVNVDGPDAP
ncbi:MAG TPA: cupin domain-containing protein [Mycobacteriales bacterium]|jgi:uncharacterized RmlC-like cupin family protein|nr:cupin domain-containing protein [Mycobacteriales bacterium]